MLLLRAASRCAPVLAGLPCVAVVTTYGELSTATLVAVGATGAVLAGVGLVRRVGEDARPVSSRGLPWLVWLVAVMAWELITFADDDLPTLSDLMDPVLARPALRGAATVGWLAAGAWLLSRPRQQGGER